METDLPPLVSCLVATTPSRRKFWPILFKGFLNQTWPNKELYLLDEEPYTGELPQGVTHIILPPKTTIGAKLNKGVELSKANYFHKMDDDDIYSPFFLEESIPPILSRPKALSITNRHLIFFTKTKEIYEAVTLGGGTICFNRKTWEERAFKNLSFEEDIDFIINRPEIMTINQAPSNYILVRHGSNTWKTWVKGKPVEEVVRETGKLVPNGPESFFSKSDLEFYQSLR